MKRSFFTFLFVLLICVVAVGFYRGWFTMSTRNLDGGGNKVNVNLTVDQDKIKADADSVKAKASELTGNGTKETTDRGDQQKDDPKSKQQ